MPSLRQSILRAFLHVWILPEFSFTEVVLNTKGHALNRYKKVAL